MKSGANSVFHEIPSFAEADTQHDERKREAARKAVRRHRERRRLQERDIGVRRCNAVKNAAAAVREMVFGKGGWARDRTDYLARELFESLGADLTAKLKDALDKQLAITPEERERKQREVMQWMARIEKKAAA